MCRTKLRHFMKRFFAGMMVAVMLAGILPEDMVIFAAEQETETVQEAGEEESAEFDKAQEMDQADESLVSETQTTEAQIIETVPTESELAAPSAEYETKTLETEQDIVEEELQEEETETVLETESFIEEKSNREGEDAGFTYSLDTENEATITGYSGSDTVINIPSTVDGYTVVRIGSKAFYKKQIKSVSMPDTITSIGDYAFSDCTGLTSIKLPEGLERIGTDAFYNCKGLTSLTIPNAVTVIENYAFNGCTGLEEIELPNGLESIGASAFGGCIGLTSMEIPKGLKEVVISYSYQEGPFCKCSNLKTVVFQEGTTQVVNNLFKGNTSLEKIEFPDTITSIGDYAFSDCKGLTSIKLPEGLERIGADAFSGCTGLTSVEIPKGLKEVGTSYSYQTGPFCKCSNLKTVVFQEGTTQVVNNLFKGNASLEKIELPDTITSIGGYAFSDCKGLTSIKLPEGLERIGADAFSDCTGLTSIEISKGLKEVGSSAFSGCKGLTSIKLPEGLERIGADAFSGCTGLTSIEISKELKEVGISAFSGCTGLTSIKLPEGLEKIGTDAFSGCTGLTSVEIPKGLKEVGTSYSDQTGPFRECSNLKTVVFQEGTTQVVNNLFKGTKSLEEIELPDTITSIGDYAFSDCTGLTSIKLPEGLERIGTDAFRGCTGLTSIKIPKGLKKIGTSYPYQTGPFRECSNLKTVVFQEGTTQIVNNLFKGITSLEEIELPDTITSIGDYAFSNCAGLTDIKFPYALASIGSCAFEDCTALTEVKLPKGLTSIGNLAFYNCTGLTFIEIPKSLETLGSRGVFNGCNNLKSVRFEEGTTRIVSSLFMGCTGLESIELPDTVTSIGFYAFSGCVNLTSIAIPDSVVKIDWYAFQNCSALKSITLPDGVTSLEANVLAGCTGLKEVVLSKNMTSMPSFKNFTNLEKITLPPKLKKIPEYAFYNTKLSEIVLPENITEIGEYAFSNTKLLKAVLPDNITTIGERIFAGCNELEDIKLSVGITTIPAYAFDHCQSLSNVVLPKAITEIGAYAFASCSSLTGITIYRKTTSINEDAFYNSDNVIIRGLSGSFAETYAEENEIKFECIDVEATQIEISPENPIVKMGDTIQLSLSILPEDYTDDVRWMTLNAGIARVDEGGLVKGISTGATTVRVTVGSLSKDIKITVVEPVSKVSLSQDYVTLTVGDTLTLTASVYPTNATIKTMEWTSSDPSVARVGQNGKITALEKGTTIIMARATDGSGCSASCRVTVKEKANESGETLTAIRFTENNLQLSVGESRKLELIYEPANTKDNKAVTWTNSAPDVVSVDSTGYIVALASGTAVVKVTSVQNPKLTDTCKVTVTQDSVAYKECIITFWTNGGSRMEPVLCKSGSRLTNLTIGEPVKEGYVFSGWYKDSDCTTLWNMGSDIVTEDITLYAGWIQIKDGLWATPVAPQSYTGKAIKPSVQVYSGTTKLVPNRDYTISYKNNTNVYTGGGNLKKPQIIVKGKGNYNGMKVIYFDILPKQISDTDVIFDNLYAAVNTQPKQMVPTALWNGKKLKYNKNRSKSDYEISYSSVNYSSTGTYSVTVSGLGNYAGTREINLVVSDKEFLSKASVSAAKSVPYNSGASVMPADLSVKLKGKTLRKGSDYVVICKNNTEIGTATAIIRGIGEYSGEKRISFNIVGDNLKNANITGIVNKEYSGEALTQNYSVLYGTKQLKLNEDYTLQYQNNVHVGTATMIFTGMNDYSGTVKKTFKILPYDIQMNSSGAFQVNCDDTAEYRKSGAQPSFMVCLGDRELLPDVDYKLTYKNNKKEGSGAQLQIKGIGNLKGSVSKSFTVTAPDGFHEVSDKNKDISKAKIKVRDQVYTGKKVTIDQSDIISITIGTTTLNSDDYEILEDTYQNNVKKGSAKVTIRGKNSYGNEKQITFKIITKSMAYLE